jgi:TetR/AcrR family transcriptional regulator, regulator of mycofactocin system
MDNTRASFERVAFALFREQGFDATTIDQLAAAVGVTKRTFFNYFPSKEALVFSVADRGIGHLKSFAKLCSKDSSPKDVVRFALMQTVSIGVEGAGRDLAQLLFSNDQLRARQLAELERWEVELGRAVAALTRAPKLECRLLAATGLAALRIAAERWAVQAKLDLPRELERCLNALWNSPRR